MNEVYSFTHPETGLVMSLGTKVRPFDPRELKYALVNVITGTADLTQPQLLSRWQGRDIRPSCENQGRMGACAAFSSAHGTEGAYVIAGGQLVYLQSGWMYQKCRQKEGSFPQDSGSYIADELDLCISGVPKESLEPYVDQPAYDYSNLDVDAPNQKFLASHHPFYPATGDFLENLWLSLQAGMPVVIGMYWTNAFFNPSRGILPEGQTSAQAVGGHAVMVWGIVPGYVLCRNQWSTQWTPDAAQSGLPDMQPGDFAIPWSYFRPGPNLIIFEGRSCKAVSVGPGPNPNPQPTPKAPSVPQNVKAVVSGTSVVVSWDAPSSDGGSPILAYNVNSNQNTINQTNDRSITFTSFPAGVNLQFAVTAVNAIGASPTSSWTPVIVIPQPQPQPTHFVPQGYFSPIWNFLIANGTTAAGMQKILDSQAEGGYGWGDAFRKVGAA